jgi:hypothetical protein
VGASIADAVNTPDDGKFIQMAPASTITLAFPAGTYAAPDGTVAADLTVHTYDALYRADATVKVYVKSNTNDWVALGSIRDDQGDVGLNLEGVGLVNEVRLVQVGSIDPAFPDLGFDLDAVTSDHTVALTEICASVTPGIYSGWAFQSTDFVSAVGPGSATPVVTTAALVDGVGYRFEAKGLYSAGPAAGAGTEILADARYSQRVVGQPVPGDLVFGYEGFGLTLLDLLLDGAAADWQGSLFNADHAYTADRAGAGVPLQFQVYDFSAANNIGGLCVSLYEDAMAPDVSGVTVTPSLVSVGSTVTIAGNADDTAKGGSDIASADYAVDGGGLTPMAALDGTFDEPIEALTATFPNVPAGIHEICVRATDKAGNTSDGTACVELKVYDRTAKVSGAIVAHNTATIASWTDRGEPDYALDGLIYAGGSDVWGSISVNYKLLGPETCTFTADASSQFNPYTSYDPDRVDLRNLLNSCDGNRYTFQLMERGGASLPRGGFFISQMPGDYTPSTDYEVQGPAALPFDYYLPIDRGNVVFWFAS